MYTQKAQLPLEITAFLTKGNKFHPMWHCHTMSNVNINVKQCHVKTGREHKTPRCGGVRHITEDSTSFKCSWPEMIASFTLRQKLFSLVTVILLCPRETWYAEWKLCSVRTANYVCLINCLVKTCFMFAGQQRTNQRE